MLESERIKLRPWQESDAAECYRYASSPLVGPIAGWPPHTSIEESRTVIREVFMVPEVYAIVLKETGLPIGCIGLKQGSDTDLTDKPDECELGYWLGEPYWGRGIMTEAVALILKHAFADLGMKKVWCGYYDGNTRSKRVQEKCGFHYMWTTESVDVPLMHETRKGHVNCLTREEWLQQIEETAHAAMPDSNNHFPIDGCKTVTHIKPTIHNPNIIVGEFTYFGDVDFEKHVTHHYDFIGDKLIIGKFCQIAAGV